MKAIQITRTGGPEVLAYMDLPTPVPGPNEVLVKAHAIGVNMPEVLVRRGTYAWMPPLPAIPGIEMSGVVVGTGADVRALRVGQPVYVSARELVQRGGCYAEYIAVAERAVAVIPAGVDLDAAATLAAYQVAYHLLHSATRGFRYESVLIQAAAGGIGSALVQLARAAGKRVIALAGSKEKAEFALSQGATAAITYREAAARRSSSCACWATARSARRFRNGCRSPRRRAPRRSSRAAGCWASSSSSPDAPSDARALRQTRAGPLSRSGAASRSHPCC